MPFSKRHPYRGISRRPLGTCRAPLSFARRPASAGFTRSSRTAIAHGATGLGRHPALTRNSHDWSRRYPLILEGFDDTLAGYRRAARHGRHATLDSVPARRLRRCRGRSRAFVSGRGVCVRLDVAEAGGALRANGSLENIFEFLLVKSPRESLLTGLKFKNPDAPAVKREAEEDWGR